MKARAQAANQLSRPSAHHTAPEGLKRASSTRALSSTAKLGLRRFRGFGRGRAPRTWKQPPSSSSRCALGGAPRYQRLSEEISELEEQLDRLVAEAAPELLVVEGVGTDTAASLLIAAPVITLSDSKTRRSTPTRKTLCGVAPIPASSGKTVRHRLNRHGDRDANRERALYV